MATNNTVNDPGVPHLSLSGGTMTGNLFLNADPTSATQAATKSYVDARIGVPIGSMQYFANNGGDSTLTSQGWMKCDGRILSQATYPTLFSQVGLINTPGLNWTASSVGFTTSSVLSMAYGNGKWVAQGIFGQWATSTNLSTWSVIPGASAGSFSTATYGNGIYYFQSLNTIVTSTDAVTWKTKLPQLAPTVTTIGNLLVYASGKYVSVGATQTGSGVLGIAVTSTDGVYFQNVNNTFPSNLYSVNFGNSLYAAGSGVGQVYTSTDALTWTQRTLNQISITYAMIYSTKWVAAGDSGSMNTSTDAITWVTGTSGTSSDIRALGYSSAQALHVYAGSGGTLATSTDAVTWTARTSGTTSTIATVTFGASVFVYGGVGGVIASSTNGITWTARTSLTTSTVNSMIFANSLFVYTTSGGGIGTSTDGTTWTARTSGTTTNLSGLTWDGTLYHAIGSQVHLTSTNAITWTAISQYPSGFGTPSAAIYGTSSFVVGDGSGNVVTTTDGKTWGTPVASGISGVSALFSGSGLYVVAGGAGTGGIATSANLTTWTVRTNPVTNLSYSTGTYGTAYVLAGGFGGIITSTDAITWVKKNNPFPNTQMLFTDIVYNSGLYVIGGTPFGPIYTSTDLNTWNQVVSNPGNYVQFILNANGLFVAGYNNGMIVSSPNAYPYSTGTQFQIPLDNQADITYQGTNDFKRSLYIKAQ